MATTDTTPAEGTQYWRLHYYVGDLAHYTAWTTDFATVESLSEQYRRGDDAHDVVIERRTEVRR